MGDTRLTEEQRKVRAAELDRIATGSFYDLLVALKEINDNEYYRCFDYETMEGYCRERCDIARSTMYSYLQVAYKFLVLMAEAEPVRRVGLSSIPFSKLIILSNLTYTQAKNLVNTGEVEIEGKIYTIADFKGMDIDELRKLINGKDEEAEDGEEKGVSFEKVYVSTEKYFTKILNNIHNC